MDGLWAGFNKYIYGVLLIRSDVYVTLLVQRSECHRGV